MWGLLCLVGGMAPHEGQDICALLGECSAWDALSALRHGVYEILGLKPQASMRRAFGALDFNAG